MRALKPFQSIVERFPTLRNKEEKETRLGERSTPRTSKEHDFVKEAEQPLDELNRAHYLLAESIDMLDRPQDHGPLTTEERRNVKKFIIEDAQDLAARVLPAPVVDLLELQPKDPDAVASSYVDDERAELRTLFLLIHAYDTTNGSTDDEMNNRPLKAACEYIMKEITPRNAEMLQEAYRRGQESGEPIIGQFRHLNALIGSELEDSPHDNDDVDLDGKLRLLEVEPGAPDSTRAVGIAAMKATNGRDMDPFVKSYLQDVAKKQRATRMQRASRTSRQ